MKHIFWVIQVLFICLIFTADYPTPESARHIAATLFMLATSLVSGAVLFYTSPAYVTSLLRRTFKTMLIVFTLFMIVEIATSEQVDATRVLTEAMVEAVLGVLYLMTLWIVGAGIYGYFADNDHTQKSEEASPNEDET